MCKIPCLLGLVKGNTLGSLGAGGGGGGGPAANDGRWWSEMSLKKSWERGIEHWAMYILRHMSCIKFIGHSLVHVHVVDRE